MRPNRGGLLLVLLVTLGALIVLPAGAAAAATVSNTNDSGPGSLRQAIINAAPGETITVPAGTYTLTSGELPIAKSLTITGAGAGGTTIRAGAAGFRLIGISGAGNAVTISGVTIRDANFSGGGIKQGAGIDNIEANLTLREVVVTNNVADASSPGNSGGIAEGAGIASQGPKATLTISSSTISDNAAIATGASGKSGGIAEGVGVAVLGSSATIEGSTLSGNRADSRGGQGPSSPSQNGGIAEGAGIMFLGAAAPSSLRATTVSGNSTDASGGPGAESGISEGAGIEIIGGSTSFAFTEITVSGNTARLGASGGSAQGGGIAALIGPPATLAITSSTVAANSLQTPSSATAGGGNAYLSQQATFANSIVSGGSGPAGSENCKAAGPIQSAGFNLDSLDQCGFHQPGDVVNRDPLLGPLQDNGGPTATMVPASNSPVVDQGAPFGLAADQRGVVRPIDFPSIPNSSVPGANGSDIGAVELQPSNAFTIGKLKKNKKKGTALLTVNLPVPNVGTLSLSGKGLKPRTAAVTGAGASVTFKVAVRGGVRKQLRRHGKRKVAISVTYTPLANSPLTLTRKAKLVLKHRHRKAHRH